MGQQEQVSTQSEEISLKELILKGQEWFYYMLGRWKFIIIVVIVGAALGFTYAFFTKPIYTANLTFALEDDKSGGLGGALGLASSFGLDLGGSGGGVFEGGNLTELFKSRSMVEKTLLSSVKVGKDTISFAELYILNNEWRKGWKDKPRLADVNFLSTESRNEFSREKDSLLGMMYSGLFNDGLTVAQQDKKTAIISVQVKSTNELFAKSFTEALVDNVSDFYKSTKSKKARNNMEILERQTDSVRNELNKAITGVAAANDNTFGLNPALNIKRAPSVRRQVDVQANTAILTELVKQTELAKVTVRKETPLIQIIDKPILPLEKTRFGKLKGFLIGGFIFGFFAVIFLTLKRLFNSIMS